MKIKKKIVLIGMMGSGKSTIGVLLSKKMNMNFIDLDTKIVTIEKQTVNQIFKLKGEKYFRELEVETILSLLDSKEKELILSLGGGSFLDEKIRRNVKNNSLSFWLNWKPLTIIKRIRKSSKRPLLKNVDIKKTISFLSSEDKNIILNAISIDLSDGDSGDYIMIPGSSSYKRIMLFNLGDKKKLTNDKMRAFGSKLYSLVNSKKIKSMLIDTKSFTLTTNDKTQSIVEGIVLGSYKFEDYKSKKNKRNYCRMVN